ncbi:hypothetical protein [Streptomyces sp. B93]|uniref:hypothetical protein n=1 Tax=Streptomyces sp. B93 TaxID=2824875 RepID=UPI001B360BA2|nr:hypothetical protein [Streptomyces sp. B93]MBQ1091622.1 hypothetical protein [Streptomyces sp. B93]
MGRGPGRAAVAAAGLAAVLLLGGCGDDGGSDDGTPSPTASATSTNTADTGGGSGGGTPSASGDLEGSWLATTGGDAVALVVTGDKAGLFATGGTVCSGTAGGASGTRTIRLTCTDGNDDRGTGRVDSVDGTTLKVTWEGGLGTETYTKAEGGRLPTGLPTDGLGS